MIISDCPCGLVIDLRTVGPTPFNCTNTGAELYMESSVNPGACLLSFIFAVGGVLNLPLRCIEDEMVPLGMNVNSAGKLLEFVKDNTTAMISSACPDAEGGTATAGTLIVLTPGVARDTFALSKVPIVDSFTQAVVFSHI